MKPLLREVWACPDCHGALAASAEEVCCLVCGRGYPIVQGVPVLLTGGATAAPRPVEHHHGMSERLRRWSMPPATSYRRRADREKLPAFVQGLGRAARVLNVGAKETDLGEHVLNLDLGPFSGVDLVGDAVSLPLQDESMDAVITQGVLEHVRHPEWAVAEIRRVLRPGGLTYHEVPFIQGYHADPTDYQRFTLDGVAALFDGFEVMERGIVAGPSSALSWVLREYLAILFSFNNPVLYALGKRAFGWLTAPVKYLDALVVGSRYAPKIASALYLIARKPEAPTVGTTVHP
ncbi:MAG: methyltransferase domain-containing protein [Anaerolineae bacterium]|nr:methyltransferase domain-containing protein [Anaerolineae bacterium]